MLAWEIGTRLERRHCTRGRDLAASPHGRAISAVMQDRASRESSMSEPTEQEISRRAYELWERAGCPEGRDKEFYHQAERELRNHTK